MGINKSSLMLSFLMTLVLLIPACQVAGVTEAIESTNISLAYYDLSNYIGEYIDFFGTIEFAYYTDCDVQIEGDDACPLYLKDSPHKINVVLGGKRNIIDTSGNIHFSDGTYEKADPWGHISALFTGKVISCDDQNACIIDIYRIDKSEE